MVGSGSPGLHVFVHILRGNISNGVWQTVDRFRIIIKHNDVHALECELSQDILQFCASDDPNDVENFIALYKNTICAVLDRHAPFVKRN